LSAPAKLSAGMLHHAARLVDESGLNALPSGAQFLDEVRRRQRLVPAAGGFGILPGVRRAGGRNAFFRYRIHLLTPRDPAG
jgi:hypothetical protein